MTRFFIIFDELQTKFFPIFSFIVVWALTHCLHRTANFAWIPALTIWEAFLIDLLFHTLRKIFVLPRD